MGLSKAALHKFWEDKSVIRSETLLLMLLTSSKWNGTLRELAYIKQPITMNSKITGQNRDLNDDIKRIPFELFERFQAK